MSMTGTNTDPTLDALYREVELLSYPDTPGESMDVLLVLADWYEDRGERPAADCLRWCHKHGKRPWRASGWWPEYHWYLEDEVDRRLGIDPASDLPAPLFAPLFAPLSTEVPRSYKLYKSCRPAWDALFAAWSVAVGKGWDPSIIGRLTS